MCGLEGYDEELSIVLRIRGFQQWSDIVWLLLFKVESGCYVNGRTLWGENGGECTLKILFQQTRWKMLGVRSLTVMDELQKYFWGESKEIN